MQKELKGKDADPLLQKVDCIRLYVSDLESASRFTATARSCVGLANRTSSWAAAAR
jgi:hypothetical protein